MKAMISLAIVSILMLSACKKSEIEDVKPTNQSSGAYIAPQKNPTQNSYLKDPLNPNTSHY